jgi:hypothetical protein
MPSRKLKKDALICLIVDVFKNLPPSTFEIRNKYNRLKFKLGSANKAKVAIANRLARSIYKILGGENYRELG